MNKNEAISQSKDSLKPERLPLTSDYVFKRVFAKEENNSMLKDLLEAILDRKIKSVIVKNPEIPKNIADEKMGILDLKLEVDKDNIIDVEMQMKDEKNIDKRSSVYLAKMVSEQLKKKQKYNEIKKVITINLLNFNYFKRNSYHSIARMKFEKSTQVEFVNLGYINEDEIATDVFEMHFIELPKFREKNPEESTKLEQWLWLLSGDREDKIKMAAEKNEEVKKTVDLLDKLSMDEKERDLYFSRLIAMMDYNSGIDDATTEGIEKGKKIGYDKAKSEFEEQIKEKAEQIEKLNKQKKMTVKKLLKRGMNIEEIAQILEITKEEVKEIIMTDDN